MRGIADTRTVSLAGTASVLVVLLMVSGCLGPAGEPDASPQSQGIADDRSAEDAWARYLSNLTRESSQPIPEIPDAGYPGNRSVVAVVDTGAHAFHAAFERPALASPGSLPVEAHDHVADDAPIYVPMDQVRELQRGAWLGERLETQTLYRLAGTRLLFYSQLESVEGLDR